MKFADDDLYPLKAPKEQKLRQRRRATSTTTSSSEQSHRRLFCGWLCDKVSDAVSDVGNAIVDTVKKGADLLEDAYEAGRDVLEAGLTLIETVGKFILTGDLNEAQDVDIAAFEKVFEEQSLTELLDIQNGSGSVALTGTCVRCVAQAGVAIGFILEIDNFNLQRASIFATGGVSIDLITTMVLEFQYEASYRRTIYSWKSRPYTFAIGPIPMSLELDVPVDMGVDFAALARAEVRSEFHAEASVTLGFEYINGGFEPIANVDYTIGGEAIRIVDAGSGAVEARIYLIPMPLARFAFIGGPEVGLDVALRASARVENLQCVDIAVDVLIQAVVGARIGLNIDPKPGQILEETQWGPTTFWQKNIPIYDESLALRSSQCGDTLEQDPVCIDYYDNCRYLLDGGTFSCDVDFCSDCGGVYANGCNAACGFCSELDLGHVNEPNCPNTCLGWSCVDWENFGIACDELETTLLCDCTGCECPSRAISTECLDTSPDCYTSLTGWGYTCDADFCPTCNHAHYCDASCNYCGGGNTDPTGVCTDACYWANDGECDDGEPGSAFNICQCGSDCTDCGTPRESCSSGTSEHFCPSNCYSHTCDYWVDAGYNCSDLEFTYNCDCGGCECQDGSAVTTTPSGCAADTCAGYSCEYWVLFGYECSDLEATYGCDCTSCDCATSNEVCPATCSAARCDGWVLLGYTCAELETIYGCDCTGCNCDGTTAVCSNNCTYSNDGECDDGGSGSLFNVCDCGSDCSDCGTRTETECEQAGGATIFSTPICDDTCPSANDGYCDDGAFGSQYITCDCGTDCTDCGTRTETECPQTTSSSLCNDDCFNSTLSYDFTSDGICDDGGPGTNFSFCACGNDCSDCGTRTAAECGFRRRNLFDAAAAHDKKAGSSDEEKNLKKSAAYPPVGGGVETKKRMLSDWRPRPAPRRRRPGTLKEHRGIEGPSLRTLLEADTSKPKRRLASTMVTHADWAVYGGSWAGNEIVDCPGYPHRFTVSLILRYTGVEDLVFLASVAINDDVRPFASTVIQTLTTPWPAVTPVQLIPVPIDDDPWYYNATGGSCCVLPVLTATFYGETAIFSDTSGCVSIVVRMNETARGGGGGGVCDDTCPFASDGWCADGGTGSSFLNLCNCGTDCSDCGPRSDCPAPNNTTTSEVCSDNCGNWTSNGSCDDGGSGSSYDVCG